MTSYEFNEKYNDFLEQSHYGLSINRPEVTEFLDKIFNDLIKINGFSYSQIKVKFGMPRFYAEGIGSEMIYLIEKELRFLLITE